MRAAPELPAVELPLEGVAAGEGDEVIVPADKIETGALQSAERERPLAAVFRDDAARDHVAVRQHAVEQRDREPQTLV